MNMQDDPPQDEPDTPKKKISWEMVGIVASIFAGRLYDSGIDAKVKMNEMNKYVHENSNCQTLWASTRMVFDYIQAAEVNTDIITMQIDHLKKMELFKLDPMDYSIKTVKQFFDDATESGFKF